MADISAELLAQVRQAQAAGERLLIAGNGSKPWMPPSSSGRLSLGEHRGIINYDPTELVVTVRAGTSYAELEAVLAEQGQMLAMEAPDFNGNSTIGGVVALGWSGSRGYFSGAVRDAVLGLRMINGLGEDLQFGGQVMKNVAGFDVSRLMVGSCGRLGAILELSLRVLPRPEQELSLQWPQPDLDAIRAAVSEWLRLGYPVSASSYNEGLFRVRFSGSAAMLREIRQQLGGEELDPGYWQKLQRLELPLFHNGWGDDKLFDCNGEVCWTAHTRRYGTGPVIGLAEGPQPPPVQQGSAGIMARVASAFDPKALFQSGQAA